MTTIKTIENDFLRIEINTKGAELHSIYNKKNKREILWQGNPEYWTSRAPVLFPIVGGLKNNTIQIDNKEYHMPKHGIVRGNNSLEVVLQTKDTIDIQLNANDITLSQYPYQFAFNIRFLLRGNTLEVRHIVKNEDDKIIHFSTGGHPAFNVPFSEKHKFADYFLEFEQEEKFETWRLNHDGLIDKTTETVADAGNILPVNNSLFHKDALIFTQLTSRKVSLKHKTSDESITVRYPDFPHLGIWSKPGAPFVCIEPWIGYADQIDSNGKIEDKEGIQELESGEMFQASYIIEID